MRTFMRKFMRTTAATVMAALIVAPSLTIFLGADPVSAQNLAPEYTVLVASGFLCDSGSCPAGAKSANGDAFEITGAGTFKPQTMSVYAAGTFTHKTLNGAVIETGVWTSSQLISFDS
jgi:hypothetical protein